MRTLAGHTNTVHAVAVIGDGRYAISGSDDFTLKIWKLASGREVHTLVGHNSGVRAVAVTPDGRYAVSGSWDKTLKVWELKKGRSLVAFSGEGQIHCCAIGLDGQVIVAGDAAGRVHFLRLEGIDPEGESLK